MVWCITFCERVNINRQIKKRVLCRNRRPLTIACHMKKVRNIFIIWKLTLSPTHAIFFYFSLLTFWCKSITDVLCILYKLLSFSLSQTTYQKAKTLAGIALQSISFVISNRFFIHSEKSQIHCLLITLLWNLIHLIFVACYWQATLVT